MRHLSTRETVCGYLLAMYCLEFTVLAVVNPEVGFVRMLFFAIVWMGIQTLALFAIVRRESVEFAVELLPSLFCFALASTALDVIALFSLLPLVGVNLTSADPSLKAALSRPLLIGVASDFGTKLFIAMAGAAFTSTNSRRD